MLVCFLDTTEQAPNDPENYFTSEQESERCSSSQTIKKFRQVRFGYEMVDGQRGAELAITISHPKSASGVIILIENGKLN